MWVSVRQPIDLGRKRGYDDTAYEERGRSFDCCNCVPSPREKSFESMATDGTIKQIQYHSGAWIVEALRW